MHHRSPRLLAAAVAAVLAAVAAGLPGTPALRPAAAQGLSGLQTAHLVSAQLRPGWLTEHGTRMVALHLQLAEGWKTYWRNPGESGIAPQIDLSSSQNLADIRIHWPRPIVFDQGGFRSIGYAGELVLPIELTPRRAGRPIALTAALSIGVCDDICVPVDLNLTAALRGDGRADPLIARALATLPRPAHEAGLRAASCRIAPAARGMELTLRATLPRLGPDEHVVVELPGSGLWVGDSHSWREGGDLVTLAQVRGPRGAPMAIDRGNVAFSIIAPDRMVEGVGCSGD